MSVKPYSSSKGTYSNIAVKSTPKIQIVIFDHYITYKYMTNIIIQFALFGKEADLKLVKKPFSFNLKNSIQKTEYFCI